VRVEPVNELSWWELEKGQRVRHFDYGNGTVDGVNEFYLWVTWDRIGGQLHHHTDEFVPHLKRA
jgi:hypothetical protein